MAKIAYPPGEISNVVGVKIEPNVIKPICTQAWQCRTAVILVVFNY